MLYSELEVIKPCNCGQQTLWTDLQCYQRKPTPSTIFEWQLPLDKKLVTFPCPVRAVYPLYLLRVYGCGRQWMDGWSKRSDLRKMRGSSQKDCFILGSVSPCIKHVKRTCVNLLYDFCDWTDGSIEV